MMTSKTAQNVGTQKRESFLMECVIKPMVKKLSGYLITALVVVALITYVGKQIPTLFPQHVTFSEEIIDGVRAVTHKDGESYADFIARAAKDVIGREVKIHDLEDNMDITRLPNLTEKDWHRLNKYLHSWRYLNHLETTTSNIKD